MLDSSGRSRLSPRRWLAGIDPTAGSGKHLEAGFWSDDRALVEHMTRFVEAVISFSEPWGSGTVGPEPDLVSVEFDDEAIAEYLAEWGPEKLSDDY
jgi:hypothetical protein